ncbi:phasin family protein [Thermoanaerobacterium sp. DL9XJH110]|uniref:phasin family protein n=1 Tax=Thermoanaerobacterium sp. DL9XJH110 TaxID=3386643 RepID=UPI003BB563EE
MLKELFYAGIGLASLTKEKAEEIVAELVKKGELSKDEGRETLNNLINRMQEERERLKLKVQEQVENIISSMNLVRKAELDEVKKRLEELEKKLNQKTDEKEA